MAGQPGRNFLRLLSDFPQANGAGEGEKVRHRRRKEGTKRKRGRTLLSRDENGQRKYYLGNMAMRQTKPIR